jgi:hypothetical protein
MSSPSVDQGVHKSTSHHQIDPREYVQSIPVHVMIQKTYIHSRMSAKITGTRNMHQCSLRHIGGRQKFILASMRSHNAMRCGPSRLDVVA